MTPDSERQTASRNAAQPSYVFRGHTSQIHSARLVHNNTCLVTGDADGYVVYWKLESKRPIAVWQAHEGAILGTEAWGPTKLITHGRDNSLRIWQFSATDATALSTVLPADGANMHRPKPWLLHSLPVNTLNFCALSVCFERHALGEQSRGGTSESQHAPSSSSSERVLVAVPARDDKRIEVYQFPDEKLVAVVPRVEPTETGMVMAVKLVYHQPSDNMLVVVGYEGGFTAVHLLPRHPNTDSGVTGKPILTIARIVYLSQPHTQPVLSLDALPDGTTYFTSAADAIIAAHRIPALPDRNDLEVPQLVATDMPPDASGNTSPFAALSRELKKQANSTPSPVQSPYKSAGTKHAGQQSLRVRSDGRLFITGGWDSRVRIYSTKTLKEMAVLKWHKEGVYAVDFGLVLDPADIEKFRETVQADNDTSGTMMRRETGLGRLQRQREEQVQLRHWVVAGAKDGKVSLWEVF